MEPKTVSSIASSSLQCLHAHIQQIQLLDLIRRGTLQDNFSAICPIAARSGPNRLYFLEGELITASPPDILSIFRQVLSLSIGDLSDPNSLYCFNVTNACPGLLIRDTSHRRLFPRLTQLSRSAKLPANTTGQLGSTSANIIVAISRVPNEKSNPTPLLRVLLSTKDHSSMCVCLHAESCVEPPGSQK